jgi:xylose dehydrogenase (NAD/NADP)
MAAVRWGILSTADINRKLLAGAALSAEVDVVAVGSRDLTKARAFADRHGIPTAYGSYQKLLADPAVEAVYNPLPNTLHCEWSIRALEAGKHVLCEKPMSSSPAEVERAFAAAERTGFLLTEAFMYRHHPQTQRLEELVAEGAPDPQHVQLRALRRVEHPAAYGRGRRLADGRRVLLHQRLAPARR